MEGALVPESHERIAKSLTYHRPTATVTVRLCSKDGIFVRILKKLYWLVQNSCMICAGL
jgi:hypothetical protein